MNGRGIVYGDTLGDAPGGSDARSEPRP